MTAAYLSDQEKDLLRHKRDRVIALINDYTNTTRVDHNTAFRILEMIERIVTQWPRYQALFSFLDLDGDSTFKG